MSLATPGPAKDSTCASEGLAARGASTTCRLCISSISDITLCKGWKWDREAAWAPLNAYNRQQPGSTLRGVLHLCLYMSSFMLCGAGRGDLCVCMHMCPGRFLVSCQRRPAWVAEGLHDEVWAWTCPRVRICLRYPCCSWVCMSGAVLQYPGVSEK